ncbi:glycosyltransferase [Aureisphaera sp. CAU 1614]|uniref:Glycosyltransferase n=1 Tax=Halomarinibacterium sedimenti TaxID=2857106 RepID=A0A9X1FPK2_9FLAO|nr:glycosyltransferase family 2 protein [Halomarinibacterium sedimenti]MBW2937724.1 glycosyltransferase [Halomarinibacterium sedimenti]
MLSIITINYNNRAGLEATLKSVQSQTYQDFEHIVIDGHSTDGSKEVIEGYKEKLSYCVSEPDNGVYQAMNKGIAVAKGEYLQFLNSGDVFEDTDVLLDVSKEFVSALDIYYGDLLFVGKGESRVQDYPDKLTFSYFKNRSLGHPAAFIKRDLFERVFYYNENLKICSDWEFFIHAVCKHNATYQHISRIVAKFDTHGMSSSPEYKSLIAEEQDVILRRDFSFFLKEIEQYEVALKRIEKPPYVWVSRLWQGRFSRFATAKLLKLLLFIFPKTK